MTLEDKVRCMCCGTVSSQRTTLSGDQSGTCDLDQYPLGMMRPMVESWLQECPFCGYVASDLSKEDDGDRAFVETEDYQILRDGPYLTRLSGRFILRASLDARRGDADRAFANTLCAAWDAEDLGLIELAKSLRLRASRYLPRRNLMSAAPEVSLPDVLRRA